MYRSALLATVAAFAFASAASAADLPARAMAPAPYAMPIFTWTGFYIGVNGGGGEARFKRDGVFNFGTVHDRQSTSGYFVGGQIGYNYQVNNFVFGVETDIQASQFSHTDLNASNYNVRYFGTVRGRIGYAFDRTLVYATGGYAYGDVRYGVNYNNYIGTAKKTTGGYTAGVGAEYAITNNWSVKAEYMHIWLTGSTLNPLANTGFSQTKHIAKIKPGMDIGRVGLNYKF
jgi:outer membrane immunogenic protein